MWYSLRTERWIQHRRSCLLPSNRRGWLGWLASVGLERGEDGGEEDDPAESGNSNAPGPGEGLAWLTCSERPPGKVICTVIVLQLMQGTVGCFDPKTTWNRCVNVLSGNKCRRSGGESWAPSMSRIEPGGGAQGRQAGPGDAVVVTLGKGHFWHWAGGAGGAAQQPAMCGAAPTALDNPAPNATVLRLRRWVSPSNLRRAFFPFWLRVHSVLLRFPGWLVNRGWWGSQGGQVPATCSLLPLTDLGGQATASERQPGVLSEGGSPPLLSPGTQACREAPPCPLHYWVRIHASPFFCSEGRGCT